MPARGPSIALVTPLAATLLALSPLAAGDAVADPLKAVVFKLELVDTSMDKPTAAQTARVDKETAELRRLIAGAGVTVVSTAPEDAEIAKHSPLSNCMGCDRDIARKLGADIEVTTAIQKTSNLILGFSGSVRDVATGKTIRQGAVEIRGNTDDMWGHGMDALVKQHLIDPPLPRTKAALDAEVAKLGGQKRQ